MKKLMLAAAAVAVAGGAFATQVYEYKAALKNMYLRPYPVTYTDGNGGKVKTKVYMKYQKATTLKGWLIMDSDGVTSPTIMGDRLAPFDSITEVGESDVGGYASYSTGYDYGRNRGFLVVINPNAYKTVRHPKILPAILDAKWLDTAFAKLGTAQSGPAEGNLYVGGDAVKPVRPQLDFLDSIQDVAQRNYIPYVPYSITNDTGVALTNYTGMVAVGDYVWTSIYLFAGTTYDDAFFNGPNWFVDAFDGFEYAWDLNLPEFLQTGWTTNKTGKIIKKGTLPEDYYHDTWMNGTGVGKWSRGKIEWALCCGADESSGNDDIVLESLSGNLKGGLFLCTENGIVVGSGNYWWFYNTEWEDQFNTARLWPADLFYPDSWQNDLWQDGFFEIETSDVIYGTWSIKNAQAKFFDSKKPIADPLTSAEVAKLQSATKAYLPTNDVYQVTAEEEVDDGQGGTEDKTYLYTYELTAGKFAYDVTLWSAIKGAAKNLLAKANVFDGNEIYAQKVGVHHKELGLPMVTPQFALFYRLVYAGDFTVTLTAKDEQQP